MLEAYTTIAAREGLAGGLYRGLGPNIVRNGIVNVCETVGDMEKWINGSISTTNHDQCMKVVYDVTKEALLSSRLVRDGILCHFSSALVAGFTATLVASPVDVVKTRYMSRCGDCPAISNSIYQYLAVSSSIYSNI